MTSFDAKLASWRYGQRDVLGVRERTYRAAGVGNNRFEKKGLSYPPA
jgi:hypothetical protein